MKIGICGTHSTGKTTLATALSKELNLSMISEQARVAAKALGIKDLDELRKDKNKFSTYQLDILRRQINTEDTLRNTGFISDRTTLDNFAYYVLNTNDCYPVKKTYEFLALNHFCYAYDVVLYLPATIKLQDDGFRNLDNEYREDIDEIIRILIQSFQNVYYIGAKNLDSRVNESLEIINYILKQKKQLNDEQVN